MLGFLSPVHRSSVTSIDDFYIFAVLDLIYGKTDADGVPALVKFDLAKWGFDVFRP